jgi:hypothetical protein
MWGIGLFRQAEESAVNLEKRRLEVAAQVEAEKAEKFKEKRRQNTENRDRSEVKNKALGKVGGKTSSSSRQVTEIWVDEFTQIPTRDQPMALVKGWENFVGQVTAIKKGRVVKETGSSTSSSPLQSWIVKKDPIVKAPQSSSAVKASHQTPVLAKKGRQTVTAVDQQNFSAGSKNSSSMASSAQKETVEHGKRTEDRLGGSSGSNTNESGKKRKNAARGGE